MVEGLAQMIFGTIKMQINVMMAISDQATAVTNYALQNQDGLAMEEITLILIFAMRYVAMEGNLAMIAVYATMAIPRTGMAAAANAKLNRQ